MTTMAYQITSLTVVYSIVYSGADKKNIKAPRHWPLCCGEFTGTGEFPAKRASNTENVSIWWRHLVHLISVKGGCWEICLLTPCTFLGKTCHYLRQQRKFYIPANIVCNKYVIVTSEFHFDVVITYLLRTMLAGILTGVGLLPAKTFILNTMMPKSYLWCIPV